MEFCEEKPNLVDEIRVRSLSWAGHVLEGSLVYVVRLRWEHRVTGDVELVERDTDWRVIATDSERYNILVSADNYKEEENCNRRAAIIVCTWRGEIPRNFREEGVNDR